MQWKNKTPLLLSAFFAVVFCSVSFTNYYVFRSAALDLGLYTNAIFDYAHFRFNDSSTFKIIPENLLSDHFDLMLMLISPLSYLFRNYTLLVIQNAALIFGGYGVFRYLQSREMNQNFCLAGMAIFYLQFSVFAAVGADYHSKVIAVSFLPWFFYYLHSKKFYASTFIFILIIICQENMSLWTTFVAAGAILLFKTGIQRKILSVYIVISILYFFVITVYVMPSMSVSHSFYQCTCNLQGTA